jgi:hypothetical protein
MPVNPEQFQIPVDFVDYARRLIIYHDPERIRDDSEKTSEDRLHVAFNALHERMQQEFDALPTRMEFPVGAIVVFVVYMANERYSVGMVIAALQRDPRFAVFAKIFEFEPDAPLAPLQLAYDDPLYPEQWALSNIEAAAAWERVAEIGRALPTVAIVDSGIERDHEDFVGLRKSGFRIMPPPGGGLADNTGYGTMIAGIIGAVHNDRGVAGAAPGAGITAVKITDERMPPSALAAIAGISYAVFSQLRDSRVRVINLSWHALETNPLLRSTIRFAGNPHLLELRPCVVVIAAGNYGSNNREIPTLPASYGLPTTIVATAPDRHDDKAWFSNYGANVDLAAPGVGLLTTGLYYVHPRYPEFSGTSPAAACVSAAAALLFAVGDWTIRHGQFPRGVTDRRRRKAGAGAVREP